MASAPNPPSYAAGDPVWVTSDGWHSPKGEHPGVVLGRSPSNTVCPGHSLPDYIILVNGYPSTLPDGSWTTCTHYLRPRKDDYQQHEARGSFVLLKRELTQRFPQSANADAPTPPSVVHEHY